MDGQSGMQLDSCLVSSPKFRSVANSRSTVAAQRPAGGLFRVHTQVSGLVGAAILKHSRETQHGCGEAVFPERGGHQGCASADWPTKGWTVRREGWTGIQGGQKRRDGKWRGEQ